MPLTLSSSNIIITYGSENITYDTVKSNATFKEYIAEPIIKLFEGVDTQNAEEQFPYSEPSSLPTSSDNGSQTFDFDLSAVIDSNGYSTWMNEPSTGSFGAADTTVGFSQCVDGYMYEFRTNHSGAVNGKWYEVLDNNKGNNWYIQYFNWLSGSGIYNQFGYNNNDSTYISDDTIYRGIWLEIGGRENMVLKKYSWSLNDGNSNRSERRPVNWLVCGSNDRKVWTPIHNVPDQIVVPDTVSSIPPDKTDTYFKMFDEPAPYKYFRWIIRKLNTDTWFAISTFKLYGYEYVEQPIIKIDSSDSDYRYIVFRNRGNNQTTYNITFPEKTTCDLLVVGGGGGGGGGRGGSNGRNQYGGGGGGGAGGLIYITQQDFTGEYKILVGKGGKGMASDQIDATDENNGYDSGLYNSLNAIVFLSKGGGVGGAVQTDAIIGGSGGGGGGGSQNDGKAPGVGAISETSGDYISSVGNSGGTGVLSYKGGGGGGSAGAGQDATGSSANLGIGGTGGLPTIISITGKDKVYAGGGGGGTWQVAAGEGGNETINGKVIKVGGNGGTGNRYIPCSGIDHTGSGGGGSQHNAYGYSPKNIGRAGNGGSGVFIIRYKAVKDDQTFGSQWTYDDSGNVFNVGNVGIGTEAQDKYALNVKGNFNYNGNIYKNNMLLSQGKQYKIESDIEIDKPIGFFKYTQDRIYPPTRNLTSANHLVSGKSYGNGVYVTNQSSIYSNVYNTYAYQLFNDTDGTLYQSIINGYDNSNGLYTGSDYLVSGFTGDWVSIQLPNPIFLTKYKFFTRNSTLYQMRSPGNYKIYGSNDGTNWNEILSRNKTVSDYNSSHPTLTNMKILTDILPSTETTIAYSHFGLVINKLSGNSFFIDFDNWEIYGKEIDYTNNQVENKYIYNSQLSRRYTVLDSDATNLVAHYKFDNNLLDSSGNNHTITLNTGTKTHSENGKINQDLDLDNTKYLIDYPAIHNFINGDDFTISFFHKLDTVISGNTVLLSKYDGDRNPRCGINIYIKGTTKLFIIERLRNGTGYMSAEWVRATSTTVFDTLNVWKHITIKCSSSQLEILVDGVSEDITANSTYWNKSSGGSGLGVGAHFGADSNDVSSFMAATTASIGFIDDMRFYNKTLSSYEIDALANNKIKVLASDPTVYKLQYVSMDATYPVLECDKYNLLAWYKLNGESKDSSENGLHLINKEAGLLYDQNTYHPLYKTVLLSTSDTNKHWALTPDINQNVPLTFAFWFRPLGTGLYTIMGYGNYPNPSIQFDYGNDIMYIYTALSNIWTLTQTHTPILVNVWYHVVYTLSNSNPVLATLYIDSKFSIERFGNNDQTLFTSTNLTIANSGDNSRGYRGNIADVRIYNKVLTTDEISTIYNGKIKNPNNYKTLTFKYNYINDMQSRADRVTGVSGWTMVKYKPVSSYWFKGNDNLQGNFVMNGASRSEDEEWSVSWDDNNYDQVLFVKGDFVSWLHINASSLDLLSWSSSTALGGNKLTNGKFRYFRDDGTSFWTSPYIFDNDVDYVNAFGDMIYQEFSDYGYGGVPGVSWSSTVDYLKYGPEQYKYYVFVRKSTDISSNTPNYTEYAFNIPVTTVCNILLVGGGGGGGKYGAGGGGGDVQYFTDVTLVASDYTIRVGNGGKGSTVYSALNQNVTNGTNTELFINSNTTPLYIAGGGGGGTSWDGGDTGGIDPLPNFSAVNNNSSGGGGGGSTTHVYSEGGNSILSSYSGNGGAGGDQGDNIGSGDICVSSGGGGGGGPVGENGQSGYMDGISNYNSKSGNGGNGTTSSITGVSVYYGGGGGGGGKGGAGTLNGIRREIIANGLGGRGGGGDGNETSYINYALANTGGGGGGGSNNGGGGGASGIVIIRYKATFEDQRYIIKEWTYNNISNSVYHTGNIGIGTSVPQYAVDIVGTITALSKNFKIDHPMGKKKILYHASVEGPRYDNMYRGKKIIKKGIVKVKIDTDCNDVGGMKYGTFAKLNDNPQLFLQNNHTYDSIKGIIENGVITITCENTIDEFEIDWLVVAERKDEAIVKSSLTNKKGNLICEQNINNSKLGTTVHIKNKASTALFWEYVGDEIPKRGVPFKNANLSLALQEKQEFTEDEWIQFNIRSLRIDNYILSGTKYYKQISINNDIELI